MHIICFATGRYKTDWIECIETHQAYCDRNGYTYRLIDKDIYPLHPKWQKFQLAREILLQGDDVLVMDADAEFTAAAPPCADVLAQHPGKDIFAVLGRSRRPNSGVIILRGGEGAVAAQFLGDCLDNREATLPAEDVVTKEGENGHFIHFLKRPQYQERFQVLGREWNNTRPPPRPEDFIVHYAGPRMHRIWREKLAERRAQVAPST